MKIALKKFGTTLTSRQAGREAFSAFGPALQGVSSNESIEVDFEGVITFAPSWGDEFLTPLIEKYNGKVLLKNTGNPSVEATLDILEEVGKTKFRKEV
ncbi:MAG: hypothetical protein UY07_C0015G0012 [Parcubacteria group bacterium GW2011_GWA1_47_8]|nr:MAG: hypothetical protein UY07_C0015G0012 [Parcubacteria group bacterium GW2011_GWA1_47_8]